MTTVLNGMKLCSAWKRVNEYILDIYKRDLRVMIIGAFSVFSFGSNRAGCWSVHLHLKHWPVWQYLCCHCSYYLKSWAIFKGSLNFLDPHRRGRHFRLNSSIHPTMQRPPGDLPFQQPALQVLLTLILPRPCWFSTQLKLDQSPPVNQEYNITKGQNWMTQIRRDYSHSVWPDGEIKSSPDYSKSCTNNPCSSFY